MLKAVIYQDPEQDLNLIYVDMYGQKANIDESTYEEMEEVEHFSGTGDMLVARLLEVSDSCFRLNLKDELGDVDMGQLMKGIISNDLHIYSNDQA